MGEYGEYWLVSAPGSETPQRQMARSVTDARVGKFNVPMLRVGTLDTLMRLSDSLQRTDQFVEVVTRKVARQLYDLYEDEAAAGNVPSLGVNGASLDHYLTNFQWEEAKFPTKMALKEIVDIINEQVSKLDEELRLKSAEYSQLCNQLVAAERRQTGSLLQRTLDDIVRKEDIIESDYLTTLVVVVPKFSQKEWDRTYETLTDFVLPRSSKVLFQDNDNVLATVTLFKRVAEDFKNAAREKRFVVRDMSFTEDGSTGSQRTKALVASKKKARQKLVIWCKTNFAEAFVGWIHIKAIRVFVESVLRYGLPVNFEACWVHPNGLNKEASARKKMGALWRHLGSSAALSDEDKAGDEYYPYVSFSANITMAKSSGFN